MNDGVSLSFDMCFSVGDDESGTTSISRSAAELMVLDFLKNVAASVSPRPPVRIASAAQRKRIIRRRETRAILKLYYASKLKIPPSKESQISDNRRPPQKSRQKHALSRPRIKGRFATKEEIAAMDVTTSTSGEAT